MILEDKLKEGEPVRVSAGGGALIINGEAVKAEAA